MPLVFFGLSAIVVLSGAVVAAWWWRRRRKPAGAVRASECPRCRRSYARGTMFCALDGARLVSPGSAAPLAAVTGRCPRCRRTYAGGLRFCPSDGEELQLDDGAAGPGAGHDHLIGGEGKICPLCASRYGLEATVCGRDGSELVTVN